MVSILHRLLKCQWFIWLEIRLERECADMNLLLPARIAIGIILVLVNISRVTKLPQSSLSSNFSLISKSKKFLVSWKNHISRPFSLAPAASMSSWRWAPFRNRSVFRQKALLLLVWLEAQKKVTSLNDSHYSERRPRSRSIQYRIISVFHSFWNLLFNGFWGRPNEHKKM